jgi:glycogen debranching enzyme
MVHEVSTNGAVFNPGNVNETPQYVSLVWSMFQWQGDMAFLKDHFPRIQQSLEWILAKDTDGNGLPEGAGMMEVRGLESEMIDVAVYTQKAFSDASEMARILGRADLEEEYSKKASALAKKINTDFWSEDFSAYADFIATDQETLHLIQDAIVRADTLQKPWAVEELKATAAFIKANPSKKARPFVVHHNWVVNTPLETGLAPRDKGLKALETAAKYTNPYGVFVTGIDRDASAGKEFGSFKGAKQFSYTGAVMTLPTGVQAIAENNYGRPDKALDYLDRMLRTFSFAAPGTMYEVSPDYGMFVQAWNLYSFTQPVVAQFFGVHPNAYEKKVSIGVQMPSTWHQASLEDVMVGNNTLSIRFESAERVQKVSVLSAKPDWQITFLPIEGYDLSLKTENLPKGVTKFTAIYE